MNREEKNKAIDEILGQMKSPFQGSKESSWEAIQQKIQQEDKLVYEMMDYPKRRFPFAIAASVLLLISLSLLFVFNGSETQYTEVEKSLTLPDQSSAFLFKNSKMSYKSSDKERSVKLKGGAIFKVEKGIPFIVKTDLGEIAVLGTAFSVNAFKNHLTVKCSEGSVNVSNGNFSEIITAGQFLSASDQRMNITPFREAELNARKKGILSFSETPLMEVIVQLENEFDIQISTQLDLTTSVYSGNFSNNNLNEALNLVCTPMGLNYKIENAKVLIIK